MREPTKKAVQHGHDNDMENDCREIRDKDSFYLEPMRCGHIGKVRITV